MARLYGGRSGLARQEVFQPTRSAARLMLIVRRPSGLQKGECAMPQDKSLFYYGAVYHWVFDPQLAEARQITVDLIAEARRSWT